MTARRHVLTSLAVATAALSLSACQQPTPSITLVNSTTHVRAEAASYCREGQSVDARNCATRESQPTVLEVSPGSLVGVDVDKAVSDKAWVVFDADLKQALTPLVEEHYASLRADFSGQRPQPGIINLQVRSYDGSDPATAKPTGVWFFQLVQK